MPAAVSRSIERARADTTNAFITVDEQAAGREAPGGSLHGLPVAIKDLIDQAGHVTTAGSGFYRRRATETAPAVTRLEAAGAVVVGRTGLHEFGLGYSSENPWFGSVLNPWDRRLSPGGSSGGSAAAVSAGIVAVALGTDTGGSIRIPAALCGIIGLKPTYGLVPTEGVFPVAPSLDTVGPLASSLDHIASVTAFLAGARWTALDEGPEISRLIVPEAWIDGAPWTEEVRAAFDEFLGAAAETGLVVERRPLPDVGPSPHGRTLIGAEVAEVHRSWRQEGRPYGEDVAAAIDRSIELADDTDVQPPARRWQTRITAALEEATAEMSVVVTPAVGAMDKRIGEDRIAGRRHGRVLSWFAAAVNPTGLPALVMPLAGPGRRPAIQFIGSRGSEKRLIALCRRLETRGVLGVSRLPYG